VQATAREHELSCLTTEVQQLSQQLQEAQAQLQQQAQQLAELRGVREHYAEAQEAAGDMQDRLQQLQQQVAELRAEAASRTPVGVSVEQVRSCVVACWVASAGCGVVLGGGADVRFQQLHNVAFALCPTPIQFIDTRTEVAKHSATAPLPLLVGVQAVSSLRRELEAAYTQLATAEAEASEARASAGRSATLALEMGRLQEDNAVLAERLEQMANDLK
jgi:flagellar biosynthesis chaperone FliJ